MSRIWRTDFLQYKGIRDLEAQPLHFWSSGESYDLVVQGTLFLLYEESIAIKNDLQAEVTLNSIHYYVFHVNEC